MEQLTAEKLATEELVAEQAETVGQLRALQPARGAAAAAQDELRAVSSVSEREQAQRLVLLVRARSD